MRDGHDYEDPANNVPMKKTIGDISGQSYIKRTFPTLYAQEDFTKNSVLYIKNDEFDTYNFNYTNVIELLRQNKLNTQKVFLMKNAPCL